MFTRTVTVRSKTGLHLRPAGVFVERAAGFQSSISVHKGEQEADGRSVLSLMLLEVTEGTRLSIRGEGEDEVLAVNTLADLLENPG